MMTLSNTYLSGLLRAIIIFLAYLAFSVSGDLLAQPSTTQNASRNTPSSRTSYLVRLAAGGSPERIVAVLADDPSRTKAEVSVLFERRVEREKEKGKKEAQVFVDNALSRWLVVELPSETAAETVALLQTTQGVDLVIPNHVYTLDDADAPNDSLFASQWSLRKIDVETAWKVTEGTSSVVVAFLDTGVELDHPDLAPNFFVNVREDANGNGRFDPWPASESRENVTGDLDGIDQDGNGFVDDVSGYDFVDQEVPNVGDWSGRDPLPSDENSHGTYVAGVIGAVKDNGIGIAGVAPGVRLLPIRAFDATGNAQDDDIAAAIVYAADRGVKVLNLSFGDYYRSPLLYDAVRYAREKGVVMVASSGNDGVPETHYPSGFSEVIGVGATDTADFRSTFSTFGSQLSLVAPGTGIVTTGLDKSYNTVGGTSFSAPIVAGTAALLLSHNPALEPDEVQAILEMTSDDVGRAGWDDDFGAGRVNAGRALTEPNPATLDIHAPAMDVGFSGDTVVSVRGSILMPLIASWSLDYGYGETPIDWTPIATGREGTMRSELGKLNVGLLPDTTITLRIVATLTTGRTFERRNRIFVDRTAPRTTAISMRNVWRFDRRAFGLTLRTDDLTRVRLWMRSPGETEFRPFELEAERVGLTRSHYIFLTDLEMRAGVEHELYVEIANASGLRTFVGSPGDPMRATLEDEAFATRTFDALSHDLPYGYIHDQAVSLVEGDSSWALMNRFRGQAFDKLVLYHYAEGRFSPVDSGGNWAPRGVGDVDGDGLLEVLGQESGETVLYEQETREGSLFATIMFADTTSGGYYPGALYDLDGDGRDELIGYTFDTVSMSPPDIRPYYFAARWTGSGFEETGRMYDPTPPKRGFLKNVLGASDVIIGNFNGNQKLDLLFGDDDSDFLVYERQSDGSFVLIYRDENDGEEGDRMIAAGDVDADGVEEIVTAYRSSLLTNADREYDPPLWTMKVVSLVGEPRVLASEEIAYVRPTTPFRAGVGLGDLDGKPGEEIALTTFPSQYVFRWDAALRRLRPLWWRGNALINRPLIHDFDRDGINELGVGDGENIIFYQIDSVSRLLLPPAGIAGWGVSDSVAFVEWQAVDGADRYRVFRAELDDESGNGQITFGGIGIVTGTSLVDTGIGTPNGRLESGRFYAYIVVAIDDESGTESDASASVTLFIHAPVRLASVEAVSPSQFRLIASDRLSDNLYRNAALDVRKGGIPILLSSVEPVDERTLLVTLLDPQPCAALDVRATSLMRDVWRSPVDTLDLLSVSLPCATDTALFVATYARYVGGNRIAVTFNMPVEGTTAAAVANYALDPAGEILSAEVSDADPNVVILTVSDDYRIDPIGYDYLIRIMNVLSADGEEINGGAGSVVGFTLVAAGLDSLFVYPHPFSIGRDRFVTFAGLPREARITIFSQNGAAIAEIETSTGDGGARWDGRDLRGDLVPPGIYLYQVAIPGINGDLARSEPKKIAVVP